jgi:hypothetical protein
MSISNTTFNGESPTILALAATNSNTNEDHDKKMNIGGYHRA